MAIPMRVRLPESIHAWRRIGKTMNSQIDFGYPWWLSYGHLAVAVPALLILLIGYKLRWPKALMILIGVVTLWSVVAFLVVRFGLNPNGPLALPTEKFLASG